MLSREFRLAFGTNSSSFPVFPSSGGMTVRYSAETISFRVLPCWFFSLALHAMGAVAQGTAAPERSPAPAGSHSSASAAKDTSGVSIKAGHGIQVDEDAFREPGFAIRTSSRACPTRTVSMDASAMASVARCVQRT